MEAVLFFGWIIMLVIILSFSRIVAMLMNIKELIFRSSFLKVTTVIISLTVFLFIMMYVLGQF